MNNMMLKREGWKVHLDEAMATMLTVFIGVTSGFVAVGPTFWVRYYGMTQGELLFLFLWTGIQSAIFSHIYRQSKATPNRFLRNFLVGIFVAARVYLQDPFLDIAFKGDTVLESLVLFGGISLALDFCFLTNLLEFPPSSKKE